MDGYQTCEITMKFTAIQSHSHTWYVKYMTHTASFFVVEKLVFVFFIKTIQNIVSFNGNGMFGAIFFANSFLAHRKKTNSPVWISYDVTTSAHSYGKFNVFYEIMNFRFASNFLICFDQYRTLYSVNTIHTVGEIMSP